MKYTKLIIIAGLMGFYASGAAAFEQTQMGGSASGADSAISVPNAIPGVGLAVPDGTALPDSAKPETGMKLRIPGFGVIGTLPKMDFGLELLYGTDRDKTVEEESNLSGESLTIHGSVKHRF